MYYCYQHFFLSFINITKYCIYTKVIFRCKNVNNGLHFCLLSLLVGIELYRSIWRVRRSILVNMRCKMKCETSRNHGHGLNSRVWVNYDVIVTSRCKQIQRFSSLPSAFFPVRFRTLITWLRWKVWIAEYLFEFNWK